MLLKNGSTQFSIEAEMMTTRSPSIIALFTAAIPFLRSNEAFSLANFSQYSLNFSKVIPPKKYWKMIRLVFQFGMMPIFIKISR